MNEFLKAKQDGQTPEVQVALYEYGKSSLSAQSGWIRQIVPLSTDLDARIMGAIRELPRHGRRRFWSRITTPRTVTVTPLRWGLLAASLALFAALGAAHVSADIRRVATPIASAMGMNKPTPNQRVQPGQLNQYTVIVPTNAVRMNILLRPNATSPAAPTCSGPTPP